MQHELFFFCPKGCILPRGEICQHEKRRQMKLLRTTNPSMYRKILKRRRTLKEKQNPLYRIKRNLRQRMKRLLIANDDCFVGSIGCDSKTLRQHLENLFVEGMSWDNYGTKWDVDHKQPLASFDLTRREEKLKACHYTNLQPLFKEENYAKGAKFEFVQTM